MQTLNIQSLCKKLDNLRDLLEAYAPAVPVLREARGQHDNNVVNTVHEIFPKYRLLQGKKLRYNTGGVCVLVHTSLLCKEIHVLADDIPASTLVLRSRGARKYKGTTIVGSYGKCRPKNVESQRQWSKSGHNLLR